MKELVIGTTGTAAHPFDVADYNLLRGKLR
jgi:hypothetical protein